MSQPLPSPCRCQTLCRSLTTVVMEKIVLVLCLCLLSLPLASVSAVNLQDNFVANWAPWNVKFVGGGQELQLFLDQTTGSGFASNDKYLFGDISMQMKLIPGNSAGTVTAYYLSSSTTNHDELDFEFLGNISGQPYVLQTNVFSNGVGEREQRMYLWFDPTADFHTYSVSWSKQRVLFLVDGVLVRVFSNNEAIGVPYLNKQPLQVFSSIWNGDSWATRGGLVKIDWTQAPFVASYLNFQPNACIATSSPAACEVSAESNQAATLDSNQIGQLQMVQSKYMIYNYCTDRARYPTAPAECSHQV